jgi:hypothetical protein
MRKMLLVNYESKAIKFFFFFKGLTLFLTQSDSIVFMDVLNARAKRGLTDKV